MKPPILDENGIVEPHDHSEIFADDTLIRRIDPVQHIVDDENRNCRRVSTKAFKPSSATKGGMSVDIKKLIDDAGIDATEYVTTPKFVGSVAFSAGVARQADMMVGFHPIDENPYHGEVWGSSRPNRFSGTQQNALLSACKWFVEIPDTEI